MIRDGYYRRQFSDCEVDTRAIGVCAVLVYGPVKSCAVASVVVITVFKLSSGSDLEKGSVDPRSLRDIRFFLLYFLAQSTRRLVGICIHFAPAPRPLNIPVRDNSSNRSRDCI